jgi:hypothetical protein
LAAPPVLVGALEAGPAVTGPTMVGPVDDGAEGWLPAPSCFTPPGSGRAGDTLVTLVRPSSRLARTTPQPTANGSVAAKTATISCLGRVLTIGRP